MKLKIFKFALAILVCFPVARGFSQVPLDSIYIKNFADTLYYDTAESKSVSVSSNVVLETGEKENLAKKRRAYVTYFGKGAPKLPSGRVDTSRSSGWRVIDGNKSTFIEIRPGGDGSYIMIDLMAIRKINKVVIRTFGPNPFLRPRAYTIYAGVDSLQLAKVAQRNDNRDSITVDVFDPLLARFVKITFDVIDKLASTVIAEVEVYGLGYLPEGVYVSKVIDAGRPVNWCVARWDADLPEGTSIEFSFKTGNTPTVDESWSDWSPPVSKNGSLFLVSEPRRYIKFMAHLVTNTTKTPVLKSLSITYQKKLVAESAKALIEPRVAPILKEVELTYKLDLEIQPSSLGVDTLIITTPTPCTVTGVYLNGDPIDYSYTPEPDRIKIGFANTIQSSGELSVKFKATLYLDKNDFHSMLISSKASYNPQIVDAKTDEGLTVLTSGVPSKLITYLKIFPNPFTPNFDGVNDVTYISFYLSNLVSARPLKVQVYDLTGRLVKTIYNSASVASAYVGTNAFVWDGRDDMGNLVRPGLYILKVEIDSDNGGEVEYRTITVVY